MNKCPGNLYKVLFDASGVTLNPMDMLPFSGSVEFQLQYISGQSWNHKNDPSFLCSDTCLCDDTLTYNANILVLDDEGNRLGGMHPGDFYNDTGSLVEVLLEAADSSATDSIVYTCRPKIRIKNTGEETLQSLRIYYYFKTESGCTPTCGVWNPQLDCSATVEHLGSDEYRVVYECTDVNVEPEEYFPGIEGVIFELRQYSGGWIQNFWGRYNDYSAEGLDSTWKETQNIVVKDMEGNVLWGVEP